jgi:hypothetical protein
MPPTLRSTVRGAGRTCGQCHLNTPHRAPYFKRHQASISRFTKIIGASVCEAAMRPDPGRGADHVGLRHPEDALAELAVLGRHLGVRPRSIPRQNGTLFFSV